MFISIKPKKVISLLCLFVFSFVCAFTLVKSVQGLSQTQARFNYTIIIDAGHGGRDNGCQGSTTNVNEAELNLKVAKKLQDDLENYGFNVIMTRTNADGLYDQNVDNFKKDDLLKRQKIVNNSKANLLISIHHNAFDDRSQKGAQVYYNNQSSDSKTLATLTQSQLFKDVELARENCNFGDYYILNESNIPAILVECGFLSNAQDESLLITDDHQNKIAYAIMCGVVSYYSQQLKDVGAFD